MIVLDFIQRWHFSCHLFFMFQFLNCTNHHLLLYVIRTMKKKTKNFEKKDCSILQCYFICFVRLPHWFTIVWYPTLYGSLACVWLILYCLIMPTCNSLLSIRLSFFFIDYQHLFFTIQFTSISNFIFFQ